MTGEVIDVLLNLSGGPVTRRPINRLEEIVHLIIDSTLDSWVKVAKFY